MKNIILALFLCLIGFSLSAKAQDPGQRYIISSGIFAGFGYAPGPQVGFETRHQWGRFETDASINVSTAPKQQSITSQTLDTNLEEIMWVTNNVGVLGNIDFSVLRAEGNGIAGTFNKGGFVPAVGVALQFPSFPGLWEFAYNQEVGPRIDKAGIESNNLKGVEISTEQDLFKTGPITHALRFTFDIDHGYDQGDPLCDGTYGPKVTGCSRTSFVTNSVSVQYMFKF